MAGLYLHIPFCKQACHYCNFHFSTSLKGKDDLVAALLAELELQAAYLGGEPLETIYLGGGTPSLLGQRELEAIFEKIFRHYPAAPLPLEVTLEANPDDLTPLKIKELRSLPVNRLSIGIQSFAEEDLRFMNRAHSAAEALACVQEAQAAGFENLTVDLIYGSPTTPHGQWEQNLRTAFGLGVPHLSCYCLTVEPKTVLAHRVRQGLALPVDDGHAARQFELLMDMAGAEGYEHYEISNFAKPGWHSRHNSSYWQGRQYLGIGPSAHSFDGASRQWNVSNNAAYVRSVRAGLVPMEREVLTPAQRYNEYVMTGLRTAWGCNLLKIRDLGFEAHFAEGSRRFLRDGKMERQGEAYRLTREGRFLADGIAAELFAEG